MDELTQLENDIFVDIHKQVQVILSEHGDGVFIELIWVPQKLRGCELGERTLTMICERAETHNWTLTLTVSNAWGADLRELSGFYMRHGFVFADGFTMRRQPGVS